MDEFLAMADLGASINLMPLSVWNKLSLPELSPTCMTLELADRLISRSVGVAEDVFVKVGAFYFSADFVVVDFDADPRVLVILERSFLKTKRALIDVYEGELTLRVGKKAVTFNLDHTSRYSANYNDMTANRIDVIDMAWWRVFIDYRNLNKATHKDHFPHPFMDQMLERLARNEYYCFLDGFSSYFQIPIEPQDQEKTTFTCPYGTFACRRMPFGLCNAPGTFQRNSSKTCLSYLDKMLQRCEDTNLCLNWEKSHFMVKEGIVLSHKISKNGIEVDKAKVDVIAKLPHPTTVKGICSFLDHVSFYRRFIQDFSKIALPMTRLLEKDIPFFFSKECVEAFQHSREYLLKHQS
uniref:Reverse transcriptase domain-containing protein n=1 Tax=Tanacetum cinerariifolium TaxID=118510 RepID=A0A6L2LGT1_TANCI|nr:reverse transcriptase domain-containing protein [Tanacetum cinerariifolium]